MNLTKAAVERRYNVLLHKDCGGMGDSRKYWVALPGGDCDIDLKYEDGWTLSEIVTKLNVLVDKKKEKEYDKVG